MKYVKCIFADRQLIESKIYPVVKETDLYFYLTNEEVESHGGWMKSRFMRSTEEEYLKQNNKNNSSSCPCGIVRSHCDYHRT